MNPFAFVPVVMPLLQAQAAGNLQVGASADVYVGAGNESRSLRQFDTRGRKLRVAAAQVNLQWTSANKRFGAIVQPWAGDNADILGITEPSRSWLVRHVAQAFVTAADPEGKWSVDAGKFTSWIGYEGLDSGSNDLYSRGILYTLAQPVYHVGVRGSATINPKWSTSAAITSGWNQAERVGGGATIGAQLKYSPDASTGIAVGVISGREGGNNPNEAGSFGGIGFASEGTAQTDLVDLIITYKATPKLSLALNADYGSAHGNDKSGTWSGWAGYAKYQANDKLSFAIRIESVRDSGGLRIGTPASVSSCALGADYKIDQYVTLRGEYRHDWSNQAIFPSGCCPSQRQSTFNLAIYARF